MTNKTNKTNKTNSNNQNQNQTETIDTAAVLKQVEAAGAAAAKAATQPEKSKAEIAYEKQLAALLAVGFSQADAEKALAAIKPVTRQAAQEMPEARWQLAKALCTLALTPESDKHTADTSVYKLFVDCTAMATDAETIKADVEQFLNKSTFANACKGGKKVIFDGRVPPLEKTDAASYAADYITGKFMFLVGLLQAEQKKYFEALKADTSADKAGN